MTGLAYVWLRSHLGARQITQHPGRLLAYVGTVVVVLIALQWLLDEQEKQVVATSGGLVDSGAVLGAVIGLMTGMILLTGPSSSRFPSRRADVAWLYTSPVTVRQIGVIEFAALCGRRLILWLGGLLLLEVADLLISGGLVEGGRFAPGVAAMIVAFSALSIGAASTRATPALRWATQGVGVAIAAAVAAPVLIRSVVSGDSFAEGLGQIPAPAREAGRLVLGDAAPLGLLTLCLITAVGLGLISSASERLRERLVLDAELWAELQAQQQQMQGLLSPRRPPFRRLSGLQGAWALSWFEIAQWRHLRYNRWSFLALLAGAALIAVLAPDMIALLVITAPLPVLVGAFSTGLVLHLRLGTFDLVADSRWVRVPASDAVQIVHAVSSTSLALVTACVVAGRTALLGQFLLQAMTLIVAAFAARTAAAGLSWSDGALRGSVFHGWLVGAGILTIGCTAVLPGALGLGGVPAGPAGLLTLVLAVTAWGAAVRIVQSRAVRWDERIEEDSPRAVTPVRL